MTVLVEALFAETLLFEDSRRWFSCGVRELLAALIVAAFFVVDHYKALEYIAAKQNYELVAGR